MEIDTLSTYAKGDAFEAQVFQFLTNEIHAGRFFCRPESCRVYRKKSYYSRDREDHIVFDISIEVFIPGLDKPALLILIECKNYKGTVPVGDIEEFGSKISQVAGVNVKGVFASASAFQSGTLNIARNKGFGVLRYFDQAEFRWELPRALLSGGRSPRSRKRAEIEYALTQPTFQPSIYSAYAVTPDGYTDGWEGLWKGLGVENTFSDEELRLIRSPSRNGNSRVTFISKDKLEGYAGRVLKSISHIRGAVDLGKIVAHEEKFDLSVSFLEERAGTLGMIVFNPVRIKVFSSDKDSHLARFTLAHELGHYFLEHGKYMTRECIGSRDIDQSQLITIPKGEVERLEWQANIFASSLLMPREDFLAVLKLLVEHHGIKNRGHGILYLDGQRDNLESFRLVASAMSVYFKVSLTAIRLRMKALGVLVEA
ncbi:ImmA/IrrE family metallo-endopeptidase [Pseudomonas aeruginosa]|uniref:ImmA/IrrE family metallo-endopeptidase n=1 Tax=Pseudomonas aeruginosa TaxID=287 RepID=UPI0015E34052|nr:ImmA/IrrE family metallo-endopeptidase [Pseudomonas aeruginosa]MBA1286559.1 ImmA/IrrE family metallo-endopeptidase [Pseudomonas aeruginosa]